MNKFITIKASIAYSVFAYATFKGRANKKKDTYEELAKEIIEKMKKYSPNAISTKVQGIYNIPIKNNRRISRKLAVAYAIIAYHTLKHSANKDTITNKDFAEEFVVVSQLYQPAIALKKADFLLNLVD